MLFSFPIFTQKKKRVNLRLTDSKYNYASLPLSQFGKVNIDNIDDEEFYLIKEIADQTLLGRIKWESQSFVMQMTRYMLKKDNSPVFNARYKNYRITIINNGKGKTCIKIKRGNEEDLCVETFVPTRPVKDGKTVGSKREMLLYNLYVAISYQVEGYLLAS